MTKRFCIICGGKYVVNKNKTVRKHRRFLGGNVYEECPGSGLEGTTTHKDGKTL